MAARIRCCPRCPLYLRDSPGLHTPWGWDTVRRLRVAPSVGCVAPWASSNLSPVGCRWWLGRQRVSVLLPERSDRCNQPSCAFGGLLGGSALLTGGILNQSAIAATVICHRIGAKLASPTLRCHVVWRHCFQRLALPTFPILCCPMLHFFRLMAVAVHFLLASAINVVICLARPFNLITPGSAAGSIPRPPCACWACGCSWKPGAYRQANRLSSSPTTSRTGTCGSWDAPCRGARCRWGKRV